MKMVLTALSAVGFALTLVSPSFAATVAPSSYPFILKGGGNLIQGSTIWVCGWTLEARTTSSSGGSILGGVGDINPGCGQIRVGPTTWSVTSATTGVFEGLRITGGGVSCSTSVDVPFIIQKEGNRVTSFLFEFASFGSGCNYNAQLSADADLNVLP